MSKHFVAVLQALFVTVLWSSSWVLIKTGLKGLPPLTFAGLRYFAGFILLLAYLAWRGGLKEVRTFNRRQWLELSALGFVMYFATQGAQFVSLKFFPAVVTALILSFTPMLVAVLAFVFLKERISRPQILGIAICLLGALIYFWPRLQVATFSSWLLLIPFFGTVANACSALLGRAINRREHLSPLLVTVVSMGIGSVVLLGTGLSVEDTPRLSGQQVGIILWLAGVNTAFAFTLWNHTQRTLTSVESTVINNTMLIQLTLLAVFVLGESLGPIDILALGVAAAGALLVQVKRVGEPTR